MSDFFFEGLIERNGRQESFVARIEKPVPSREGDHEGESVCVVHAPGVLRGDKKIYGADAEQARELAFGFLRSMLDGQTLRDKDGRKVDVSKWGDA